MIQRGVNIPCSLPVSQTANNTIAVSLTAAMGNYKRHFELFSSVYYLTHPEKRELTAKQYALLSACNELVDQANYMVKEVFEVYKSFEEATVTHYKSFIRKLSDFRKNGATTCIHKRISQTYKERYKLNNYVDYLIYSYLCDPHYYSYNYIKKLVNSSILEFNEKHGSEFQTISTSTVAKYYRANCNEINYYRKGKRRFDIENRPYLPGITAKNAGSLYQMDGTPIQIFCWNPDRTQKIRLNLFVIRDAYSGKIT